MRAINFAVLAMAFSLVLGCAAKSQTNGTTSYSASNFGKEQIESGGIAILPVVAGAGVEGYRRPFANAINESAKENLVPGAFVSWRDTMNLLNEADLVEEYQDAISAYASTSIIPRNLIEKMSEATGTQYFLFVSLNPPVSSTRDTYSALSSAGAIETNIGVSANGQVWNTNGDVVWEGSGSSEVSARSDNFQVVSEEDKDLAIHSQRAADALFDSVVGMK